MSAELLSDYTLTKEHLSKIYSLRDRLVYFLNHRVYFPSQKKLSNAIIKSVFNNEGQVFAVSFTRQHGKTTIVTDTDRFLKLFYFSICEKLNIPHFDEFNTGFFAPQQQQAQTGFNMLKDGLVEAKKNGFELEFNAFNGNTIVIENPKRQAYCFTASPTSHPESKTLHLIFYDEAQDLDDRQVEKAIEPMGAATNATQVFIGVGGYKRCRFQSLLEKLPSENKFIVPVHDALKEREQLYTLTRNPIYRNYKFYIEKTLKLLGIDEESDHYKTQYLLQWILERGQFITYDNLMALGQEYEIYLEYNEPLFGGIDWGKMNDSTVFTVINQQCHIIGWHEFLGDDYSSQIEQIIWLIQNKYKGMKAIGCDSTGTQDMGVDMLRAGLRKSQTGTILVNGINFSTHKDPMYKNLSRLMHNVIGGRDKENKPVIVEQSAIKFPINYFDTIKKEKFIRQFLDLQKEIKNNKWSCNHPEGPQYHDDYCFVAGTLVLTDKGQVPIELLKIGNRVMTRNGFKKIMATGNRMTYVIERFGLTGTFDHPIITKKGIKRFINVSESDKVYIWNEKLSSIGEGSITDIQILKEDNYEFITGDIVKTRKLLSLFTDKSGKINMFLSLKGMLFIIKTEILLIIKFLTLKSWKEVNINHNIVKQKNGRSLQKKTSLNMQYQRLFSGTNQKKEKSGIGKIIFQVLRNLKNINIPVLYVKKFIQVQESQKQNFVLAGANKKISGKERVFNIAVKDCNEYFVNNLLVHNCDSLALACYNFKPTLVPRERRFLIA